MKLLTQVILSLENSTEITLPAECISLLELDGINALTSIVPPCNRPNFKIRFRMKLEYYSHYTGTKEDAEYFTPFLFGSNRYNITDITLNYSDESVIKISLPWENDIYDSENRLEKLTHFDDGEILIEIPY